MRNLLPEGRDTSLQVFRGFFFFIVPGFVLERQRCSFFFGLRAS